MKSFDELLDTLNESSKKHLAYLNGVKTHAKKMGGKWTVGGDFIQSGDRAQIAVKHYPSNKLAWHNLQGNRLKFDDFLTDHEVEEHHKLNEEYLIEYTAQDAENHVGKNVVLGNSSMSKRSGKLEKYKKLPDGRHALTINGMELHVSSHHPLLVNEDEELLIERKLIRRIRKGKMVRKLICGRGLKNVGNNKCVRMSGSEKMHRRMGMRKAIRTKKSRRGKLRRSNFLRQRSMLRRRSMGLH